MTPAAKSIFYFGIYVILVGPFILFFPQVLLDLLGFVEQPGEHLFIYRVVGIISICVGTYYVHCGRTNQVEFFKITVFGRTFFFFSVILIVLLTSANPILMLFGITDFIGAIWTFLALKKS